MKTVVKRALGWGGAAAEWRATSVGRSGLVVLLYHAVPPGAERRLGEQLRALQQRYRFIDPFAVEDELTGPRPGRAPALVTFDDGYRDQARVAATVLEPLGIRACFFLVSELVGLAGDGWRAFVAERLFETPRDPGSVADHQVPMSWRDAATLVRRGHRIGSHGATHRRLSRLATSADVDDELVTSADRLEAELGTVVDVIAYPFGGAATVTRSVLTTVAKRYRLGFSGVRGVNGPGVPRLGLRRESLSVDDTVGYVRAVTAGALSPYYRGERRRLDAEARAL